MSVPKSNSPECLKCMKSLPLMPTTTSCRRIDLVILHSVQDLKTTMFIFSIKITQTASTTTTSFQFTYQCASRSLRITFTRSPPRPLKQDLKDLRLRLAIISQVLSLQFDFLSTELANHHAEYFVSLVHKMLRDSTYPCRHSSFIHTFNVTYGILLPKFSSYK